MALKDAVKINSKCFFTYELKDSQGDETGLFRIVEQEIQSRTILGIQYTLANTPIFKAKDFNEMAEEIKKEAKYRFKESDLSDEMKERFKKENLDDKIEKDEQHIINLI